MGGLCRFCFWHTRQIVRGRLKSNYSSTLVEPSRDRHRTREKLKGEVMSPLTLTKSQFRVFLQSAQILIIYSLQRRKKSPLRPPSFPLPPSFSIRGEIIHPLFACICAIHVQGMAPFTLHGSAGACNFFVLPILPHVPILAIS
jgi:hypothetical protein